MEQQVGVDVEVAIEQRIQQMTLRQKIGQLFICGFQGTEVSPELKRFIEEYQIGGLIYFARNVDSIKQVATLSLDVQQIAADSGNLPLWVSIDQEGGMVARITDGIALMPGNMAIAAVGSPELAYKSSYISGMELRSLGINMNFAPVLDVNNNALNPVIGVRSFGEDPELVAEFGVQAVRGLQEAQVVATAKHFPGHGDTAVDSHLDLPTVTHGRERMDAVELVPFKRAIADGLDAMMSAHIYFPALETQKLPVTLSHAVLTGLLREELQYEGLIMTDCLEMNAIAEHYGTVEAAVMAVEAGADTVLISQSTDSQIKAIAAMEQAVNEGRITESRIEASVKRLLTLKAKRGLMTEQKQVSSQWIEAKGAVHQELAREISEESMTLLRNESSALPLKKERTLVITVAASVLTGVDEIFRNRASLGAALSENGLDVSDHLILLTDLEKNKEALLREAGLDEVKQIVIGTYNAHLHQEQIELVQQLQLANKPLVVVALRNPYDLSQSIEASALVAAYESRPLALQSAAKALLGMIPFKGSLPVTLSPQFPAGFGLQSE